MLKSMLNKKTAVLTLAATALLGGGVAMAYPPGTDLTVAAVPSAGPAGQTNVLVTVSNDNPSCSTTVSLDDAAAPTTLGPGQTTTTITVPTHKGSHRVEARNSGCDNTEHAHADYLVLAGATTNADSTATIRKNYQIGYSGFAPGTSLTVVATGPAGSTPLTASDTADRRGNAKVKFKFRTAGAWSIVTTSSGGDTVAPFTVTVS